MMNSVDVSLSAAAFPAHAVCLRMKKTLQAGMLSHRIPRLNRDLKGVKHEIRRG
jgi:hypothetical protein